MSQGPGPVIESSGGGSSRTGTGAATGVGGAALTGSTLDSQSANPSRPGGGGESLQACMGFWDSGTHMTRAEWRRACQRTRNRLDLMSRVP
jgi:hypothetical protein